ncbi:MAG: hypothetical protein PVJ92_02580, partial [Candidatus Dependentiae bacterium]
DLFTAIRQGKLQQANGFGGVESDSITWGGKMFHILQKRAPDQSSDLGSASDVIRHGGVVAKYVAPRERFNAGVKIPFYGFQRGRQNIVPLKSLPKWVRVIDYLLLQIAPNELFYAPDQGVHTVTASMQINEEACRMDSVHPSISAPDSYLVPLSHVEDPATAPLTDENFVVMSEAIGSESSLFPNSDELTAFIEKHAFADAHTGNFVGSKVIDVEDIHRQSGGTWLMHLRRMLFGTSKRYEGYLKQYSWMPRAALLKKIKHEAKWKRIPQLIGAAGLITLIALWWRHCVLLQQSLNGLIAIVRAIDEHVAVDGKKNLDAIIDQVVFDYGGQKGGEVPELFDLFTDLSALHHLKVLAKKVYIDLNHDALLPFLSIKNNIPIAVRAISFFLPFFAAGKLQGFASLFQLLSFVPSWLSVRADETIGKEDFATIEKHAHAIIAAWHSHVSLRAGLKKAWKKMQSVFTRKKEFA